MTPAGRKVRCAQCGETWREAPPPAIAAEAPPLEMSIEEVIIEEQVEVQEAFEPQDAPPEDAPPEPDPAPPAEPAPPAPGAFTFDEAFTAGRLASQKRERLARAERKAAQTRTRIVLAVGAVVLTLIAALALHEPVVQAWPAAASAYAALGVH